MQAMTIVRSILFIILSLFSGNVAHLYRSGSHILADLLSLGVSGRRTPL